MFRSYLFSTIFGLSIFLNNGCEKCQDTCKGDESLILGNCMPGESGSILFGGAPSFSCYNDSIVIALDLVNKDHKLYLNSYYYSDTKELQSSGVSSQDQKGWFSEECRHKPQDNTPIYNYLYIKNIDFVSDTTSSIYGVFYRTQESLIPDDFVIKPIGILDSLVYTFKRL